MIGQEAKGKPDVCLVVFRVRYEIFENSAAELSLPTRSVNDSSLRALNEAVYDRYRRAADVRDGAV